VNKVLQSFNNTHDAVVKSKFTSTLGQINSIFPYVNAAVYQTETQLAE